MALLDVQLHECAPTRVSGSIAADQRHHQPWGIVHGGLYTTAIETFATVGARATVKDRGQQAVGVANATDFLRPHRSGRLEVVAVGSRTITWHDPLATAAVAAGGLQHHRDKRQLLKPRRRL